MNNWTIKKRIVIGFTSVITLVVGLAIITTVLFGRIRAEARFLDTDALPGLESMAKIQQCVAEIQLKVLRAILAKNPEERKKFQSEIADRKTEIAKLMADYAATMNSSEDKEMFKSLEESRNQYIARRNQLFELLNSDQLQEAIAFNISSLRPSFEVYRDSVDKMFKYNIENANKSSARSNAATTQARVVTLALSGVVVLLGITLATVIVIGLNRVLSRVALTLSDGSTQIVSAATQVSSSSQSLAEGASEQAASVEETGASIEELSSITKRNAESAQKVNDFSRQARTAADQGATDMEAMSQAMTAIKASSDDIAKIIKTIDEIAFQTNILALNAAVEAARAGEAGMGFAVVADEVRNLAQRCAQSAKETSSKIEGAVSRSTQGVELSEKVARGLQEIVAQIRKVDELAAEVASGSNEQSRGIAQVSIAIGQIDKVTQSNAANAEESASAAEEMNAQALALKDAVSDLLRLTGTGNAKKAVPTAADRIEPSVAKPSTLSVKPNYTNGHAGFARQTKPATEPIALSANRDGQIPMPTDFKDF
jgi:methyl-accepting chemotaxis protein